MRSLTALALLFAAGCSVFEADADEVYTLRRVNGLELPVSLQQGATSDGRTFQLVATSGRLTFYTRGTYRMEVSIQRRWSDGSPDATFYIRRHGAFTMLSDTAVQVRFRESGAWDRTNYRRLESGNLLRATQNIAGTSLLVYDYRR